MFEPGRVEFENVLALFRGLLLQMPTDDRVADALYRVNVALYGYGNVRAALHHARETLVTLHDEGKVGGEVTSAIAFADMLMPRMTPSTAMFSMN